MSLGSPTAEDAVIAGVFGSGTPASFTAHLYEGDPTDAGVEVSGFAYSPPTVTNDVPTLGTPSGGQLGPFVIDFGSASGGSWGVPDFVTLEDSGNFYLVQEINNPDEIDDGDPVTVSITIDAQ